MDAFQPRLGQRPTVQNVAVCTLYAANQISKQELCRSHIFFGFLVLVMQIGCEFLRDMLRASLSGNGSDIMSLEEDAFHNLAVVSK